MILKQSYNNNQKTLKCEDDFMAILKCILDVVTKQIVLPDTYLMNK